MSGPVNPVFDPSPQATAAFGSMFANPTYDPWHIEPVTPSFVPLKQDNTLAIFGKFAGGGDVHEHIFFDSGGDIARGMTTVRLPGLADKHLPW